MSWQTRKTYGVSRPNACIFCNNKKIATTTNKQGVPTCLNHKANTITDWKCICGEYLDGPMTGKYGVYFRCLTCGNVNFYKACEVNVKLRL